MIKKRFQLQGMHCASCAMLIDGALEDLPGVRSASTSYARQIVEVEYDADKVSETEILSAVEDAGYTASAMLFDQHG